MQIQRVVSYYARPSSFSTGGVNRSRQEWMKAISENWVPVKIVSARGGFTQELVTGVNIEFSRLAHLGRGRMTLLPLRFLREIRQGDLVYLHEGWTPSNYVAALACKLKKVPYIVMPHGVYDPEIILSLRAHRLRTYFESLLLRSSLGVHLFFPSEELEVGETFGHPPTFSATTGWDMPVVPQATQRRPIPYLSWLGRFDIKHKGIDRLLAALAKIESSQRPKLRMRGPDHRGDKARVLEMVEKLGLNNDVEVGPELTPADIAEFLQGSSAFVHVPRWEAFGRSILDAIENGTPLLLSEEPRISNSLREADAAIVVDADVADELAQALVGISSHSSTSMAARATAWVQNNLDWGSRVAIVRDFVESRAGA